MGQPLWKIYILRIDNRMLRIRPGGQLLAVGRCACAVSDSNAIFHRSGLNPGYSWPDPI